MDILLDNVVDTLIMEIQLASALGDKGALAYLEVLARLLLDN